MKRRHLVFLLLLLALGLYGWHVGRNTETWDEVPPVVLEDLQAARDGGERVAGWLAERFAAARDGLDKLDGNPGQWLEDLFSTTPESEAPPTVSSGSIQVFFGPAPRDAVDGMDDHFVALLNSARESIYCALYDLGYERVAAALIAQHGAGVQVALVGESDYADRQAMQNALAAGIPVRFDERSALMHNKFCVVDGVYVWTGSANITENGFYRNNNNAVLIASPELALNFFVEFEEMWEGQFGATSPVNTPHPELLLGETRIATYFSPEDGVQDALLAEINATTQSIDFMAFSFTSQPIADAMVARMQEGVHVRGLFETRNAGSEYSRDNFLADRGAEIYLDTNPHSMHHKVMILDGHTVVTGSYNFSRNAERNNDENVLIITDPTIAAAYTAEFEAILQGTR